MAGSLGSPPLVFFKSDNGLIEIRAKIRIIGTNDAKLDFRLRSVCVELGIEISVLSKVSLFSAYNSNNNAIKWQGGIVVFVVGRGKDKVFSPRSFPSSEEVVGCSVLRK